MAWVCAPVWGHSPLITYFKTDCAIFPPEQGKPHNIRAASESLWSHTHTFTRFRRQTEVCLALRCDWRTGLEAALQQLWVVVTPTQREVCEWTVMGDCVTCSKGMGFLKAVSPDFSLCECFSKLKCVSRKTCVIEWISQIDVLVQFHPIIKRKEKKPPPQIMFC